jgi:hypothetical protein
VWGSLRRGVYPWVMAWSYFRRVVTASSKR